MLTVPGNVRFGPPDARAAAGQLQALGWPVSIESDTLGAPSLWLRTGSHERLSPTMAALRLPEELLDTVRRHLVAFSLRTSIAVGDGQAWIYVSLQHTSMGGDIVDGQLAECDGPPEAPRVTVHTSGRVPLPIPPSRAFAWLTPIWHAADLADVGVTTDVVRDAPVSEAVWEPVG